MTRGRRNNLITILTLYNGASWLTRPEAVPGTDSTAVCAVAYAVARVCIRCVYTSYSQGQPKPFRVQTQHSTNNATAVHAIWAVLRTIFLFFTANTFVMI